MGQMILLGLTIVGFAISLSSLLFYLSYRLLPCDIVSVKDVQVIEQDIGSGVIFKISVAYNVGGVKRRSRITLSGRSGKRDVLLNRARALEEYYKTKQIGYFHLPVTKRIGLLESPVTYPQLWVALILTPIFLFIVVLMLNHWF